MKVLINGELSIDKEITHQELIEIFFAAIKSKGLHYEGQSKIITEDQIHNN